MALDIDTADIISKLSDLNFMLLSFQEAKCLSHSTLLKGAAG